MKLTELSVAGAYLLDSPVHGDERGLFREWFKETDLTASGVTFEVRQANLSRSARGVVRGLHYSLAPQGQAKLVTCVEGTLDEVIVDIRLGSPTFGAVVYLELNASDGASLYVPAGTAHGFCVISQNASLAYLLSSPYNPQFEFEINPMDQAVAVPWRLSGPAILATKDADAPSLDLRRERNELPTYSSS